MTIIEDCYQKALDVLRENSTEFGFLASRGRPNCIWNRDGSLVCLGAVLTGDNDIIGTAKKTLVTLKEHQTSLGQLPNVVYLDSPATNYYAIDATAWWIIAVDSVWRKTMDIEFLASFRESVDKAITWLHYQAIDLSGLIMSPPAADWMDSSIQRWGKVFYNNLLYYRALICANEILGDTGKQKSVSIDKIKAWLNLLFWPTEMVKDWISGWGSEFYEDAIDPNRTYYLDYLSFESYGTHCDVASNCMAIVWDVPKRKIRDKIIGYLRQQQFSTPYPIQVLGPPVFQPSLTWNPKLDLYRPDAGKNLPYCYHNAGIWPWVGGLYVAALVKAGRQTLASKELEKLAEANKLGIEQEWEFNEWLHGKTGKPMGDLKQTWNASGYILAYKAVTEGLFI